MPSSTLVKASIGHVTEEVGVLDSVIYVSDFDGVHAICQVPVPKEIQTRSLEAGTAGGAVLVFSSACRHSYIFHMHT